MRLGVLSAAIGAMLLFAQTAFAEGDKLVPTVISFGGTGEAKVITGGLERPITVGLPIEYGSTIKTAPENSVTIQYPDDSILAVDADTEVEVQERTGGTQANKLNFGQIRASVVKLRTGQVVPARPRFVVRTKAAVMGVRGTEFIVAVDPTGYTTQMHTLEGVVEVATDEAKLMSGSGTGVGAGRFIEASGKGLSAPQSFDSEEFMNSLKPSTPGGPSGAVFTKPNGHTIPKPDLAELADPRTHPEMPEFKKEEQKQKQTPEKQKEQQQQQAQEGPKSTGDHEEGRVVHLASFEMAFLYTSGFSDPEFGFLRQPYVAAGFADRIRALNFSWNPTVPIPLTGFLSLRGHFGFIFAREGSLANRLWANEAQAFVNATFFRKVFGELGIGKQTWLHSPISAGLFTVNVGLSLRNHQRGFEIDRIFIGRSLLLTHPRVEEFRAGFGFAF